MINKVVVRNFKKFKESTEFELKNSGVTLLAGGNNSGKSTLLQALAVWEFARSIFEINKGVDSLYALASKTVGVNAEEFTPIALPDLKYLFHDMRSSPQLEAGSHSLKLRCDWKTRDELPVDKHLEFGIAHANNRLFFKTFSSNLGNGDIIPRIAYLPAFAGITSREELMTSTRRKRWIGRGLSGAILRNLLYESWKSNQLLREQSKNAAGKISGASLAQIRKTDSWERLKQVLEETFKLGLTVNDFNQDYHTYIDINVWEGALQNTKFKKKPNTKARDLIVEGSGFLQWLSVYALALDSKIDVLLLDEPDAHLHPSLQGHLMFKLSQLARETKKQVLVTTHSTTILSESKVEQIFHMEERKYIVDDRQRIAIFAGLGSQYSPKIDQLKKHKKMLFHEGPADIELLKIWARIMNLNWPENIVCWPYTRNKEAREILFDELKKEIPHLKALSLVDRDTDHFSQTKPNLTYNNNQPFVNGLGLRQWRRKNIENYLLHPDSIARAANCTTESVLQLLITHSITGTEDTSSQCNQTLANTDGKDIITKHSRSISNVLGITYLDIARSMIVNEIPDDVKTFLTELMEFCSV